LLLLDTHALVLLAFAEPMSRASRAAIDAATPEGNVLVSPVSAWEIGLLVAKGRLRLFLDPMTWIETFLSRPGIRLTSLSIAAATRSSFLPDPFHADPADRLLVATARELAAPLVTRDRKILDYAEAGHVRAIAC
jgi:PIN domain nuclease of toxin-antitoxin system